MFLLQVPDEVNCQIPKFKSEQMRLAYLGTSENKF